MGPFLVAGILDQDGAEITELAGDGLGSLEARAVVVPVRWRMTLVSCWAVHSIDWGATRHIDLPEPIEVEPGDSVLVDIFDGSVEVRRRPSLRPPQAVVAAAVEDLRAMAAALAESGEPARGDDDANEGR